jgi:hypothetical protein
MEVGTKQLGIGKKEEAYDLFNKAYNLYSLFWGLNLKLINVGDIKKISDGALNKNDDKNINNRNNDAKKINSEDNSENNKEKNGIMGKLGTLVKKAIDCCIE